MEGAPRWPGAHSSASPAGAVAELSQGPRSSSSAPGLALSAQRVPQARGPAILTPAPPGTPAPHHSKSGTDPGERERRNHEPGPSLVPGTGRMGRQRASMGPGTSLGGKGQTDITTLAPPDQNPKPNGRKQLEHSGVEGPGRAWPGTLEVLGRGMWPLTRVSTILGL